MTRETKIGLLVGLAFIIVIGILLSDHLTNANEPQQAQLAQVGGNARSAVTVPGAPAAPQITTVPAQPQAVTPQQPVPTKEEITPKQPPVEIVQIGGAPVNEAKPPVQAAPPQQTEVLASQPGSPTGEHGSTPIARTNDPAVPGSLANVADTMGEELVPVGSNGGTQQLAAPLPNGCKRYKAEPGDNLAKIALKTLGKGSKANCDAIIAANPTLQQNPNLIVAGRNYVIPSAASAPAGTPTVAQAGPVSPVAPVAPAAGPEYFYTVKSGDSLTRIAIMQLGNAGAVEAIKDLNRDQLKGGDIIRPNMKLRLPAKPMALAS